MQFGFMPGRSTRRHIYCTPVTRKVLCHQKNTVHSLCRSQNDMQSCTQKCHLVGSSQARHWWVVGAAHTEHVWKHQKQGACWLQPEWRVQYESGCSPRLLLEPLTVHHGSGSPLPEFCTGCDWENLHADDLVIITEVLKESQQLILWKTNIAGKGLRVNMGKSKVLISGPWLNVLQKSGKDPCCMCLKGVSTNSIFCGVVQLDPQEMQWHPWPSEDWCHPQVYMVHWTGQTKRCLTNDRGHSELGEAWDGAIILLPEGLLFLRWRLWTHYYHKMRVTWGKLNQLLPVLTSSAFPITSRVRVYNSCARSAILHASETWAPTLSDLHCLHHNDRAMIRWMCGVITKDQVSS